MSAFDRREGMEIMNSNYLRVEQDSLRSELWTGSWDSHKPWLVNIHKALFSGQLGFA